MNCFCGLVAHQKGSRPRPTRWTFCPKKISAHKKGGIGELGIKKGVVKKQFFYE